MKIRKKSRSRISRAAMSQFTNARRGPVTTDGRLDANLLRKMDAWWRAANYLSVGQTYLYDNPLLKETLRKESEKRGLAPKE